MEARPSIIVAAVIERGRCFIVAVHRAARIRDRGTQQAYAVDSWYFDNGHPAAVLKLEDWLAGKRPDGA